ncbi:hypothetical protein [Chryseobacterium cheonjiense]|uniref:Addiction module component n=1 Tax=Chryseobacterium cheonjiense TaxID=2728845 RepID=A0A7Y0A9L0_9FLAO|nr:hypothetical protein [Chryseobacterium cheonjiense]NML59212.1 hypothetical protein [Chryseobacterium cheonjiense]
MNTSDLKIDLIKRITQLKEPRIIEELQNLLDFELSTNEYILTDSQKERIAEAQQEYRKSEVITDEQASQDIEQWLKEK